VFYQVVGVGSVGSNAYLLAHFWPDQQQGPPALINDFLIGLQASSQSPVTDSSGRWQLADGTFVIPMVEVNGDWQPRPDDPNNPYVVTTTPLDLAGQCLSAIAGFVAHAAAVGLTGDLTDPGLVVTAATGLAADPSVQGLLGSTGTV
jgi:hypothetical protein